MPRVLALVAVLLLTPLVRPQGHPADRAAARMTPADGLDVVLVASEPAVRQPVAIDFDDRGRLWTIQYLQYPNPAGLRRVTVDRYSRTAYDRVPEPPPRGPRGADRVTILDDFDAAGRARRARDFVNGLNLASGFAFGHGGVFVLQVPYLLFYPDRDGDDVPDGDPDVCLDGFGMEDAHSVANSLTFGPDGWLYGCQGSTVTARIRGIEFQQGVWRYHPITRRFELFCEGGGNSWGLDFDRHGHLLYSTNVGGSVLLHGVQGGYYWKQFGKHGALHNPYAFGFFDHVPHERFQGGHVTVGGLVYQADALPARYRNRYLGADLLGHALYWHELSPHGSSFRSAHGGDLVRANDTWFAPCDLTTGPDGRLYVADWHDARTAHPDPDAEWDRSNGRVFRVGVSGPGSGVREEDVARLRIGIGRLPTGELVKLLGHPNDWFVRKARQALADRRDPEVIFPLRTAVLEGKDEGRVLQSLWALYVSGGWNEAFARKCLGHASPHVRRWAVRFLGDDNRVSPDLARRLASLAAAEPDVHVRGQLASSARRLPAADGLPVVAALLKRGEDATDPHLPLLAWWAVEAHAMTATAAIFTLFEDLEMREKPLARDVVLPRLVRRWAADGRDEGLRACVRILGDRPSRTMLAALDEGLRDRPAGAPPVTTLASVLGPAWRDDTDDAMLLRLGMRLGRDDAVRRALALASDRGQTAAVRVAALQALAEAGPASAAPAVLPLAGDGPEPVRRAALDMLRRAEGEAVAAVLVRQLGTMPARLRAATCEVLLGRKGWARLLLEEVEAGRFAAKEVPVETLRLVALHRDPALDALVVKHWGTVREGTPGEKLAVVRRYNNDLRAGPGDAARGRELFTKHCAGCHRLFDEGERTGPELTHANRKDRDFLLVSLVDPGAVVRREYQSHDVETKDGRVLSGLVVEDTPARLTVLNARNERTTVARDRVESVRPSPVSLMPDNLLTPLSPQQLRDLFAYLQK